MEYLTALYMWVDAILIYPFRIINIPIFGYYMGCSVVAMLCVLVGQTFIAVAFRWNKRFIDKDNHEMVRMHNLSMRALAAKDKKSYTNCNKQANEAFGKVFFSQIALAVSSLWPIPFAVGWLQTRFLEVDFALPLTLPGVGNSVGFLFTFLPIYILTYIFFGKIKHKLPFFKTMSRMLAQYETGKSHKLIRITDLVARPTTADDISPL